MGAKMEKLTTEELLEILGVIKYLFDYFPENKEEVDREVGSLLVGGHNNHLHKHEMTYIETRQEEDFFEFNSIKPLKHI